MSPDRGTAEGAAACETIGRPTIEPDIPGWGSMLTLKPFYDGTTHSFDVSQSLPGEARVEFTTPPEASSTSLSSARLMRQHWRRYRPASRSTPKRSAMSKR